MILAHRVVLKISIALASPACKRIPRRLLVVLRSLPSKIYSCIQPVYYRLYSNARVLFVVLADSGCRIKQLSYPKRKCIKYYAKIMSDKYESIVAKHLAW